MRTSELRFNPHPYHPNDLLNQISHFQEQGFVVLRDVIERESVNAYREQVEAAVHETPEGRLILPTDSPLLLAPTYAPRLRQVLPYALSHAAMKPNPALFEAAWLINRPGPPVTAEKGWHKDRDHEGMPGREYHYPKDVHVGLYLADMTPEHGPTECIPRSHRDPLLSPFSGASRAHFLPRQQDVVLWDQRMWHRATARSLPGLRLFAIFGFYSVPVYGPDRRFLPEAMRQAWLDTADPYEEVLYGGAFGPALKEGNK
jgi:hypothetical protein